MSKAVVQQQPPEPPIEHPGLAAAYAAEAAAVRLIADLKTRKRDAAAAIETARAERDGLATRAAKGEPITGADLRRATEALADAEAELQLVTETLPAAVRNAYAAGRDRSEAEREVIEAAHRPYRAALARAEASLRDAHAEHAKASVEAGSLPQAERAALDDLLDRHGRDESAAAKIAELRRLQQANDSRKQSGQPLVEWP